LDPTFRQPAIAHDAASYAEAALGSSPLVLAATAHKSIQ